MVAGHTGPGPKAIVPASATAKLSFRLVPDQQPGDVAAQLRSHVARHTPAGVETRLEFSKPSPPYLASATGAPFAAARRALTATFGREPAVLRSGGTISVVSLLSSALRVPVVLMGFAQPSDGMHGPDERFSIDSLERGSEAFVRFLHELGSGVRARRAPAGKVRVAA
jgi:acetylornithine deacetylase/succinyl-diaminopimelate desuccinylase-like protein